MRRTIIPEQTRQEIERVAVERAKLPTDVELAAQGGVSRRRIQQIMKLARTAFLRVCVGDNPETARNNPGACTPSSEDTE